MQRPDELRAEPISRNFKIRLIVKDLTKLREDVALEKTKQVIDDVIEALLAETTDGIA